MNTLEYWLHEKLNVTEALNLAGDLSSLPMYDEYLFDFRMLNFAKPFGMLLAAASIRKFVETRSRMQSGLPTFEVRNHQNQWYLAHVGFFKSLGIHYGKLPGEAPGGTGYLPITRLKMSTLQNSAESAGVYIGEAVERESCRLACVLVQQDQGVLVDAITYSLREIMRNAIEHSGADSLWYSAQHWPRLGQVELALLDEGVGIRKSLSRNPQLNVTDDGHALVMALQPGISGVPRRRRRKLNNTNWQNSGYGLFMSSQLCRKGGIFTICSGSKVVTLRGGESNVTDTSLEGTGIRMVLRTRDMNSLRESLEDIRKEGEALAKKLGSISNPSASLVSRMLLFPRE